MGQVETHQLRLAQMLESSPVIPVLTLNDVTRAVPLARALSEGGLHVIEITLRTPDALAGLARIRDALPNLFLGAGTVLDDAQLQQAISAGVDFAVSPGATDLLLEAALTRDLPLLAGATTPSETQHLLERGYRFQKFFPAQQSGGIDYLKALHGPLPDARFCPTGGVNGKNAADFLSCPNVVCVGGSWVAPAQLVEAQDWPAIQALAATATSLADGLC